MDPTDLIGQLLAALDSAPPSDTLGVLTGFLADAIGSRSTSVLLVDYDLNTLTPLPDGTSPSRPGQPVEGTDAGTVFRSQKVLRVARPERVRVSIPISLRAERLGVLELDLPPESEEPGFLHALRTLGTCTAYVLKTALPLSDVLERARRREPMALLQWALQPLRGFDGPAFSIARQLVPAYEVGGDMFDYAVQAGSLQVAVTDAMGHGLHASLLTTLAVNTLRNERRSGAPIEAQAVRADQTLHAQFAGEQFVTGLILEADLATGKLAVVNAGSPLAYRVNDRGVACVRFDPELPCHASPGRRHDRVPRLARHRLAYARNRR